MTTASGTTAPDYAAIKKRQQATWASGDYHMIATQIQIVSELVIEALDVHSTERVLDVATGSGNAAIAAARRGCTVVGVDYVPELLDRARRRADAEGLTIDFVVGDAETLPFDDDSFDVVSSVFGAMFAPDQEQTATELGPTLKAFQAVGDEGRGGPRERHPRAHRLVQPVSATTRWSSRASILEAVVVDPVATKKLGEAFVRRARPRTPHAACRRRSSSSGAWPPSRARPPRGRRSPASRSAAAGRPATRRRSGP